MRSSRKSRARQMWDPICWRLQGTRAEVSISVQADNELGTRHDADVLLISECETVRAKVAARRDRARSVDLVLELGVEPLTLPWQRMMLKRPSRGD